MIHITFNDYKKMPWKNGQGITYEVQISPATSTLSELNFDYRISMAQIKSTNSFSKFKNYNRVLTVLKGSGITFNDEFIHQYQIKEFSGNIDVQSKPVIDNEEIIDLGVIYDPLKVKVSMKLVNRAEIEALINKNTEEYLVDLKTLNTFVLHQNRKGFNPNLFEQAFYIGVSECS